MVLIHFSQCKEEEGVPRSGTTARRLFVLRRSATDHRDAAAADQFLDAVASHPFDESFDLVLASGNLDHEFLGPYVHDLAAEDLHKFANLAPLAARGGLDFEQHQVPFDVVL